MNGIPVAQRVAKQIRDEIIAGAHPPGARLPEEALARQFETSRNSVREAFRLLEHEGFLEHRRHRGVSVPKVGPDEIVQLYAFRRVAELGAIVEMTSDQMRAFAADLQPMATDLRRAIDEGDSQVLSRGNSGLHMRIIRYAGSPMLDRAAAAVFVRMRLAMLATGRPLELRTLFSRRNLGIIAALAAGNGLRTRHEVRAYLEASLDDIMDTFSVPAEQRRPHPLLP